MLKFRIPEIALGALLTIAVFAMGFLVASSMPPPSHQVESSSHPKPADEAPERAAEKQIAEYTKYLAWFTGALVIVSALQGYFLLRADKTARIAANAAEKSANAANANLISQFRPRLRIRNVMLESQGGPADTEPIAYFAPGNHVSGRLNIVNVGGSRADIQDGHCMVHWIVNNGGLPMTPPYEGGQDNLRADSRTLLSGQSATASFVSERPMGQEGEDVQSGAMGQTRLFVMGWVTYFDRNNDVRRTTFCREFRLTDEDRDGRFYAVDHPDYEHED